MKIFYASPLDILQRRRTTNRLADLRFCESLAAAGAEVTLVASYAYRSDNMTKSEVRDMYEIETPLAISVVPTPLWHEPPRVVRVPVWSSAVFARFMTDMARLGGDFERSAW